MKGVFEHFNIEVGERKQKGEASLSAFEFKHEKDPLFNLRQIRDGGFPVKDGKYVRLVVNGELVMTDTDMERVSNREFCLTANGKVLIAGLGIGLILKNILLKIDSGEITDVTIVEKSKDVIDLVGPYFKHKKNTLYSC